MDYGDTCANILDPCIQEFLKCNKIDKETRAVHSENDVEKISSSIMVASNFFPWILFNF